MLRQGTQTTAGRNLQTVTYCVYCRISKQDGHLANLLTRLDSQGFYTQRLKIALSSQMILEK